MIETLTLTRYRKLKGIELKFVPGINILSGTNGTCKSSILHIISNSFQSVKKSDGRVLDHKSLECINKVNSICNPKIESLTRGDKKHNDPAPGHKGELYSVKLENGKEYSFRRHNSPNASRYSVKPYYKRGKRESLFPLPTIYLGLFRLFPYGEFQDDGRASKISKTLPQEYLDEISMLYKDFTGFDVSYAFPQNMGEIKKRAEFSTDKEGIDSNTVSAGEDNLFIILTAIVSLKYYYKSINSDDSTKIESIFLIDELDASLHPAFQIKLLELFKNYSEQNKIQIFFTTHSFSLLREALKNKTNVIYLLERFDNVVAMHDVDIFKIDMDLQQKLRRDMYFPSKIPIFTEDEEARTLLREIFDYFSRVDWNGFARVQSYFHIVDASAGAKPLTAIFKDKMLLRSTLRSICILDGDDTPDISNCIMTLPGGKTPESFIIDYARKIYDEQSLFWSSTPVTDLNYTPTWCKDFFLKEAEDIETHIQNLKDAGDRTHGLRREMRKDFFKKYEEFILLLMRDWLNSPSSKAELYNFYSALWTLFKKVSDFHGMFGINWAKAETLG